MDMQNKDDIPRDESVQTVPEGIKRPLLPDFKSHNDVISTKN
jgi:hypothetical protein